MPKSSLEQIDIDEKKVIRELEKGSNESIDTIAKRCGFSRQKVWRIIKRLEKNKTIWGYHAVIDDENIGLRQYFILIKRTSKSFSKDHINSIINRELQPEAEKLGIIVEHASYVHGDYDGIHVIRAKNVLHAKKYCEILNKYSIEFIENTVILEELFPIENTYQMIPVLPIDIV